MHLALANKLLPDFDFAEERDINNFILGNIVPDIKKGDLKKHTHFWNEETMALFERKPDLSLFLKQYGDSTETCLCSASTTPRSLLPHGTRLISCLQTNQ